MKQLLFIFVLITVFTQCKTGNEFEKEASVIDSTKVVLQVKLNELKRSEQNLETIGFNKFEIYSTFLHNNLKDTISRSGASVIQQFINAGNTLKQFEKGKEELVKQTELSIAQLQKLSSDVKENNLQPNAIQAFYSGEKNHAEELISAIEQNIKALNMSSASYKSSLPRTEEFIRSINNGNLPIVVQQGETE